MSRGRDLHSANCTLLAPSHTGGQFDNFLRPEVPSNFRDFQLLEVE
jgi:hypothetical protein